MSFFFFSLLHPLPTVGKGLVLKAKLRCLETATMLKKHSIMWLFGNVATAPVWGDYLSALVNMFGTCAAVEQSSVYRRAEKNLKVYLLRFNMKCKEIYHLNMQIIFADISLSHAVHQTLLRSSACILQFFHINFRHTLLSGRNVPTVFGIKGHK